MKGKKRTSINIGTRNATCFIDPLNNTALIYFLFLQIIVS